MLLGSLLGALAKAFYRESGPVGIPINKFTKGKKKKSGTPQKTQSKLVENQKLGTNGLHKRANRDKVPSQNE